MALKNAEIIGKMYKALYSTAGRRTNPTFAITVIGAITRTLEQRYEFLKYLTFNSETTSDDFLTVDSNINSVNLASVCKAIETVVEIVYMDLHEKAGLYFIKELKKNAGENAIYSLREAGIDLDLIQIQHHFFHRRESGGEKPSTEKLDNKSLLGYSWETVSKWELDSEKKVCVVYGKDGKVMDRLNLEAIVKNYVGNLGGGETALSPDDCVEAMAKIDLNEKDLDLLEIIQGRDINAESAANTLHISENELQSMINKLLKFEILHYISADEVALTEIGAEYLDKKGKLKKAA